MRLELSTVSVTIPQHEFRRSAPIASNLHFASCNAKTLRVIPSRSRRMLKRHAARAATTQILAWAETRKITPAIHSPSFLL